MTQHEILKTLDDLTITDPQRAQRYLQKYIDYILFNLVDENGRPNKTQNNNFTIRNKPNIRKT